MSFVKKAIKKVVKTVKKIVKSKVFKIVAIAALTLFTAGVAAGGFAAFSGVSSIGGFFTAVGQTIATGASAIAGGLGFKGASASLAQYGGAAAEAAGLSATSTISVAAQTLPAGMSLTEGVAAGMTGTNAAGSGFLASVKGFLGKKVVGDATIGELAVKGVSTGIAATLKSKQNEKQFANGFVAGDVARGGGSEAPPGIDYEFGNQVPQPSAAPSEAVGVEPTLAEDPTVAAQLAQGGQAQPSPANRIQALIQERGPINQPGYAGTEAGLVGRPIAQPGAMQYEGGLVLQGPTTPAVDGRRFNQQATQLQYAPRGLV